MKTIMKEWKSFLETKKTYHRVVLNEIIELTEEDMQGHSFPLSDEEYEIIKQWAGLSGYPTFLGSGTMGSAYSVDGKVLKLTRDSAEAQAAARIVGKENPNVYEVYNVGRRQGKFSEEKDSLYVIMCELIGGEGSERFPDKEAQEIIKSLYSSSDKVRYKWPATFNEALSKLREAIEADPSLFEQGQRDYELVLDKAIGKARLIGMEAEAVKMAWKFTIGFYKKFSPDAVLGFIDNKKKEMEYINQLCSGMTFLKENGVTFQDLKTTNVLQENDGNLVIIDIGKSSVEGYSDIPIIK